MIKKASIDKHPQDYKLALGDFLEASNGGHVDATVSAGAMLHQGAVVPQDQRKAFELYQLAGELGSMEGWRNIVACYVAGEGVPQSLEMARYITETILKPYEEETSRIEPMHDK